MTVLKEIKEIGNFVRDAWINRMSGVGTSQDKRVHSQIVRDGYFDEQILETLYEDDLFRRICTILPDEGVRQWVSISSDVENKILNKLASLNARSHIRNAWVWAQVFGGGAVVMTIDDGRDSSEPVNEKAVKDVIRLNTYNRFRLYCEKHYTNKNHPKYKQPMVYRVESRDNWVTNDYVSYVHESRILRFDGMLTADTRRVENQGWGDSLIARTYDLVRDYGNTYRAVFAFLDEFGVGVYKFKNLASLLASDNENKILKRMSMIDAAKSMTRGIPLDADNEDYERASIVLSGLGDVLDRVDGRLSAGVGAPLTLLLGKPQGGLNSTGEGDQRNWYNKVSAAQETDLYNPISRLVNLCGEAVNVAPKHDTGHSFQFNPLWSMTDKDREEARWNATQRDEVYMKHGVLTPSEVRENRYGGFQYSYETHLKANKEAEVLPRGDIYQVAAVMKLVSEGTITPEAATSMITSMGYSPADASAFTAGSKASQADMTAPKQVDVNQAHKVARANENSPNKT